MQCYEKRVLRRKLYVVNPEVTLALIVLKMEGTTILFYMLHCNHLRLQSFGTFFYVQIQFLVAPLSSLLGGRGSNMLTYTQVFP